MIWNYYYWKYSISWRSVNGSEWECFHLPREKKFFLKDQRPKHRPKKGFWCTDKNKMETVLGNMLRIVKNCDRWKHQMCLEQRDCNLLQTNTWNTEIPYFYYVFNRIFNHLRFEWYSFNSVIIPLAPPAVKSLVLIISIVRLPGLAPLCLFRPILKHGLTDCIWQPVL